MKISIALENGLKIEVGAKVYGQWAAHHSPHIVSRDDWRVTHVPSGLGIQRCADGMSKDDALRVAKALSTHVPELGINDLQTRVPDLDPDLGRIIEATIAEALS